MAITAGTRAIAFIRAHSAQGTLGYAHGVSRPPEGCEPAGGRRRTLCSRPWRSNCIDSAAGTDDIKDPQRYTRHLGIFGGTFDPIHIGHLIVAEEARARLNLDGIVFVPARVSPFKQIGEGTRFTAEERLAMVRLAIAGNDCFIASDVDVRRQGPSYTVDTLRLLHQEYGAQTRLHFIMGMDSLEGFANWRSPREILRLARLVVISRPGYEIDLTSIEARMPGISDAIDIIRSLEIGISSTDIRARLDHGLPIRYQVPTAVERYIDEHCVEAAALGKGDGPPAR